MTAYVLGNGDDYFGSGTTNYATYNTVYGLDGNDTIYGYFAGAMTIEGGSGNDFLETNSSVVTGSTILGGSGNDIISAASMSSTGSAYLDGGTGSNTIYGGGSFDIITGNGSGYWYGSNVANATNEFYDLYNGGVHIFGGANAYNKFHLSGGGDSVVGGNKGDSYYISHYGYNSVAAGNGGDTFDISSYSNSVTGGSGSDVFNVSGASNVIKTGNGANTVYAVSADQLIVNGGSGNDVIFVGGTYTSTGSGTGLAYNAIQVNGGGGNDTIDGTAGRGVLYIAPGTGSGVNVVTGDDVGNHIYGQNNTGQLYMRGGRGGDEMVGGQGGNTFITAGGDDFVRAGGVANVFCFNAIGEGGLHVANFNASTDRFAIYAGGFGSQLYGGETLTAGYNLINGSASTQQTGTFLYHDSTLFFDADGTGSIGAVALAGFTAGVNAVPTSLSANNFTISGTKL